MLSSADLERAYREHQGKAFAAASAILRDDAAAEDVVQDVFLTLWRSPAQFDARRGSLATYVALLARSRALDRHRSRAARVAALHRRAEHDSALVDRTADDAVQPLLRQERVGRLLEALAGVPAPQRQAVLASAHGLTAREIAGLAGIPVATAKSRVRIGLLKAHAALAGAP